MRQRTSNRNAAVRALISATGVLALAAVFACAAGASTSALTARSLHYRLIDLGTLGGATTSSSVAINASGQVVGAASLSAGFHAFLYSNGRMSDLGTLGGDESIAHDINNRGEVVGEADTADNFTHAFLYRHGAMHDLGTLGGAGGFSAALASNNRRQIVGGSTTAGSDFLHPFLYSRGVMVDLSEKGLPPSALPRDLNDSGEIVGEFDRDETFREQAFIYRRGQMVELNMFGGRASGASAVNERGTVVGAAALTDEGFIGPFHGFVYRRGSITEIGTLGGGVSSPIDINEHGDVVGFSTTADGTNHAFLLHSGHLIDLNDVLASPSNVLLSDAVGINNRGQIAGDMYVNGELHAFLLLPR